MKEIKITSCEDCIFVGDDAFCDLVFEYKDIDLFHVTTQNCVEKYIDNKTTPQWCPLEKEEVMVKLVKKTKKIMV